MSTKRSSASATDKSAWAVAWQYAAAILTTGIVLAIAAATIAIVTRGHSARTTPPPTTTSSSPPTTTSSSPPPPRVDSVADFDSAFQCSDGHGVMEGGADYYGGPPNGMTTTQGEPDNVTRWQPQILSNCVDVVTERLKPLGVTIVTAPTPNTYRRVRYFTAQTLEQDITLQKYLLHQGGQEEDPISRAAVGNTGFCVQDVAPCERYY